MNKSRAAREDSGLIALLVGPVPPPLFGQAIGMQILLDAPEMRRQYRLLHVNTNNVGRSAVGRFLHSICSVTVFLVKLLTNRPEIVYLMVSRSRLGCVRDWIIIPLGRLFGASVVVHLRGGDMAFFHKGLGPLRRRLMRWVYRHVRLAIVLGESLRGQFDGLVPPERVRVVFNCWHDGGLESPSPQPSRSTDEPLRLSFVSNVLPSKGLYEALEGVAWAMQRGVKLEFRFAGSFLGHDGAIAKIPNLAHENLSASALKKRYEDLVEALGIENNVLRLGVVAGRQKWELLAQTDVLLLPIYNPTEGQPLAAIEAMRLGCALITTRCGGLVDIIEEDVTGKAVPPHRPDEIGRAIKWFWDHPAELERIGKHNVVRAEQVHGPERHVSEILHIFEEACLGGRR